MPQAPAKSNDAGSVCDARLLLQRLCQAGAGM